MMVETNPDRLLASFGIRGNVAAIIMIVFGILVIVLPKLISLIVGIYLIVHGLLSLDSYMATSRNAWERPRYDDHYYNGDRQRRGDQYRERESHGPDDNYHDREKLKRS